MVTMSSPRTVLVLGSTGSIGTQALDVTGRNRDLFRVVGLAAGGSDPQALAEQVIAHEVEAVAVTRATVVEDVQLGDGPPRPVSFEEVSIALATVADPGCPPG